MLVDSPLSFLISLYLRNLNRLFAEAAVHGFAVLVFTASLLRAKELCRWMSAKSLGGQKMLGVSSLSVDILPQFIHLGFLCNLLFRNIILNHLQWFFTMVDPETHTWEMTGDPVIILCAESVGAAVFRCDRTYSAHTLW